MFIRLRSAATLLVLGSLLLTMCASAPANPGPTTRRVFEIGNSLTADAVIYNGGIDAYAAARSTPLVQGRSIRWGMGIKTQWEDYTSQTQATSNTTLNGYGYFQQAFANNTWDAITLQPFSNSLSDEMTAAKHIVDLARTREVNRNADLYLYAPWPGLEYTTNALTFSTRWQAVYSDPGVAVSNFPSKGYFRACFEQLRTDFPENDVYLIPTGEVFEDLVARIARGEVDGVSDGHALYIDGLHASESLGRYAASVAYYTGVMRQDPRGLPVPAAYASTLTPAQAAAVQESIWHVFTSQALNTGLWAPGDVNGDGLVVFDDLLTLAQNYGKPIELTPFTRVDGDLSGDGLVDFSDLLELAQNYGASPTVPPASLASDWALAQSMVPEPTLVLLPIAFLAKRSRRRE